MTTVRQDRLIAFREWVATHIRGDEKGEAQIFLDRLFQAFGQRGVREVGATLEMRIKKANEGGTAFADLVWKPVALIEMKRRGADLNKHYRQAFDGGLRAMYRTLELPGANPLKDAHATLDAAVLAAYGFSSKTDLLAQLLDLNHTVARRIESGQTVTAPGIPPDYSGARSLVTDDCVKP